MGKPVVVFGVASVVDPTDGFLFAHLAGAVFEASGGVLTITPELVPAKAPDMSLVVGASPTYDEFRASAFANATYHDQGGTTDYIDPNLTYDRAKLATL